MIKYSLFTIWRRVIASFVLVAFLVSNGACPVAFVHAQEVSVVTQPGSLVALSPAFTPPLLKGIKVYPSDPLRFDFILDKGDLAGNGRDRSLPDESLRLIKYFLASLTISEKDLWVNLSPYEKERIVPADFGRTAMGRDLLEQDYLLKQVTASLLYPEGETGKLFWQKVYAAAYQKFGSIDIPVDIFNKVWIVPAKAVIYEPPAKPSSPGEKNNPPPGAYVLQSRLKVMLEADYLATSTNAMPTRGHDAPPADLNERG
ncbi:MAG: hypothetical protein HQL20_04220, partial [Candidatus Omnitrophica bacterium]|nr:hypothetical protein [Candidatus Omnitrophota bacterium]